MIQLVEIYQFDTLPEEPWPVGTCFRAPIGPRHTALDEIIPGWRAGLSSKFLCGNRDYVWVIVMPTVDEYEMVVWSPDLRHKGQEFNVEGDNLELLTITPKVNFNEYYQGQIINGYLTGNEIEE